MNQRDLDRKRQKAKARRAAAKVRRTAVLKANRFEKVDGGWKLPESFMTGENP
jgi:hypothetical protein